MLAEALHYISTGNFSQKSFKKSTIISNKNKQLSDQQKGFRAELDSY